ncbi:MAG: sugar phosphate nucleotidyltransferase, partial [bacterium]|nr:sugar phosphate nucleotidyltransferase [bacterium]
GDDIVVGKKPALQELIDVYNRYEDPVIALKELPKDKISHYGVIDGKKITNQIYEIKKFVEKPSIKEAPSNLAVVGKYILTPEIIEILRQSKPGKDGEIRIADAFETYIKGGRSLYGAVLSGRWYECGNKLGWLIAQVELGLTHPELNGTFRDYLKSLKI